MDETDCDKNEAEKAFLETMKKMEEVNQYFFFMNALTNVLAKLE